MIENIDKTKKNNYVNYLVLMILCIATAYCNAEKSVFVMVNYIVVVVFGYIAAVSDFRTKKVSNVLIRNMLIAWAFLIVIYLLYDIESATEYLFFGVVGFLFIAVVLVTVYFLSKKGLGGADVKFMSVAALYVGLDYSMNAMLVGAILAAITASVLVITKKMDKKDTIPLIPFFYIGLLEQILLR